MPGLCGDLWGQEEFAVRGQSLGGGEQNGVQALGARIIESFPDQLRGGKSPGAALNRHPHIRPFGKISP